VGQQVAAQIRGAEFQVLEGGGHLGHFEEPGRFNGVVLNWLAGQGLVPERDRSAAGR
jgi:pimeloyl-ACP methyl ester carboxylesterase